MTWIQYSILKTTLQGLNPADLRDVQYLVGRMLEKFEQRKEGAECSSQSPEEGAVHTDAILSGRESRGDRAPSGRAA